MKSNRLQIYARYLLGLSFLIMSVYSIEGVAMSSLLGTEVVLFSPLIGKITYQGKPAANAKIVRLVRWKDDAGESDIFHTTANGEFSLPIKTTNVRIPMLAEFVISQEVTVIYNGSEFDIWLKSTTDIDEYGGLGGNPKNLRCELTDEAVNQENFNGLFSTSCKWDLIIKKGKK